jgi:hypothetical protein
MFAADQELPKTEGAKRSIGCRGAPVTPRREEKAAARLQRIIEPPGAVAVPASERSLLDIESRVALERLLTEAIFAGNTGNAASAVDALSRSQTGPARQRRGETLTVDNLTRIVEQARDLIREAG